MSELFDHYLEQCIDNNHLSGISLELTDSCNLACSHCYRVHGNSFLSSDVFYKVIEEIEALGAISVSFNGGEPTLHALFLEYAQFVLDRGFHLTVLTNGLNLPENVLNELSRRKNLHFQVSLYGVDALSGEKITGNSEVFENTLANIFKLQKLDIDFRVALIVLSSIADRLSELIERLQMANIDYVLTPNLFPMENGNTAPLTQAATESQILSLLKYERACQNDINEPTLRKPDSIQHMIACGAGLTSLGVRVDGRVVACQVLNQPVLGQLPIHSLQEIWSGVHRMKFIHANQAPSECIHCDVAVYCNRCPAAALFETEELTGIPQESCRIAHLRSKFHIDSR